MLASRSCGPGSRSCWPPLPASAASWNLRSQRATPGISPPEHRLPRISQVRLQGTIVAGKYKLLQQIGEGGMGDGLDGGPTRPSRSSGGLR